MWHAKLLIIHALCLLGDWRPRWCETCCHMIFVSAMCFRVLDQFKNLTPVWKCFEIELPSLFCLNNLEKLSFLICLHPKDFLLHHPRHGFILFHWIYQNVNYFPGKIWKEKENKVNREDLRGHCLVSTHVKRLIYIFSLKKNQRPVILGL